MCFKFTSTETRMLQSLQRQDIISSDEVHHKVLTIFMKVLVVIVMNMLHVMHTGNSSNRLYSLLLICFANSTSWSRVTLPERLRG